MRECGMEVDLIHMERKAFRHDAVTGQQMLESYALVDAGPIGMVRYKPSAYMVYLQYGRLPADRDSLRRMIDSFESNIYMEVLLSRGLGNEFVGESHLLESFTLYQGATAVRPSMAHVEATMHLTPYHLIHLMFPRRVDHPEHYILIVNGRGFEAKGEFADVDEDCLMRKLQSNKVLGK